MGSCPVLLQNQNPSLIHGCIPSIQVDAFFAASDVTMSVGVLRRSRLGPILLLERQLQNPDMMIVEERSRLQGGTPMYPISRIILSVLGQSETKRQIVERAFGYKNQDDARRNLDLAIETGRLVRRIRCRLHIALRLPRAVIAEAIAETEKQKAREALEQELALEAERRRTFRPHLLVLHQPARCNLALLGLTLGGAVDPIRLPKDIAARPTLEQVLLVQEAICTHQQRYAENAGLKSLLKGCKGYAYRMTYDRTLFFSPEGVAKNLPDGLTSGRSFIKVGGKVVNSLQVAGLLRSDCRRG